MKFNIKSLYFLFILLFNFIIKNSLSDHHRYFSYGPVCRAHPGAAIIVPECMKYIYGDDSRENISEFLKEFIKIKNDIEN